MKAITRLLLALVETGQAGGTVYIRRGPGMFLPLAGYATPAQLARAQRSTEGVRMNKYEKGQTGILFALILALLAAGAGGAYVAGNEMKAKQTQDNQALAVEQAQVTDSNKTIQTQAEAIKSVAAANETQARALLENAQTISNMAADQAKLAADQLAKAQAREDALNAREMRLEGISMAGLLLFIVVTGGLMTLVLYLWEKNRKLQGALPAATTEQAQAKPTVIQSNGSLAKARAVVFVAPANYEEGGKE